MDLVFWIWEEAGIKQYLKRAIMFESDLHNIVSKLFGTCSYKTPCLFGCLIGISYVFYTFMKFFVRFQYGNLRKIIRPFQLRLSM